MARFYLITAMIWIALTPFSKAYGQDGYFTPGASFIIPMDTTSDSGADFTFGLGWAASLAIGVATERGWRGEVEFAYHSYGIDSVSGGNAPATGLSGDVQKIVLMGNLLRDFARFDSFTLFAGLGGGAAKVDLDFGSAGSVYDTVFAYQGILGLAFPMTDYDYLDIQYRYFDTVGFSSGGLESNFPTHMLTIGLRLGF